MQIGNGHAQDLGLDLATRVHELLKRTLSAQEITHCALFLDDFAYLSIDDVIERMRGHLEHCKANNLPIPRTLYGFRETLRSENDFRADHATPKAWRPQPIAGDLVRLSETLGNRYATPAPVDPAHTPAPTQEAAS